MVTRYQTVPVLRVIYCPPSFSGGISTFQLFNTTIKGPFASLGIRHLPWPLYRLVNLFANCRATYPDTLQINPTGLTEQPLFEAYANPVDDDESTCGDPLCPREVCHSKKNWISVFIWVSVRTRLVSLTFANSYVCSFLGGWPFEIPHQARQLFYL